MNTLNISSITILDQLEQQLLRKVRTKTERDKEGEKGGLRRRNDLQQMVFKLFLE
jgi:hypothetical protein